MKKFLLILGMLTCIFSLAACGEADNSTNVAVPFMTEQQAKDTAEQLISQVNEIVSSGMKEMYSADAVSAAAFDSWESAVEEMGGYQNIIGYDIDIKEDSATIVADIAGNVRDGKVTIVFGEGPSLTSITTTVNRTMGELMEGAALNTLLGMGTVFAVLILIMWIISAFKIIYNLQQKPKQNVTEKEKSVDQTIAQIIENEELSDDTELVAVIAAAIAASEGAASTDGFVVRSIRRANTNKWKRA